MTAIGYVAGILGVLFFMATLGAAAVRMRIVVLPEWRAAPARLVDVVLAISLAIAISGLLGAVHVFYRVPALIAAPAAAAIVVFSTRRRARRRSVAPSRWLGARNAVLATVTLAIAASVWADWIVRVRGSLNHGMSNVDTLWYHMPFAARFVQHGSISSLSLNQPDAVTPFFPANNELLHAVGILLLGHDTLSPLLNLGWLALALLAGWLIGRPYRASSATLVAVAIVAGTFIMAWSQGGEATNDMAGLSLFLASIALVVNSGGAPRPLSLAALPAGIALGMKVSLIIPVAALAAGVVLTAGAGLRRRVGLSWLGALVLLGGYWYARNLVATGNPLPWIKIGIGSLSLPVVHASSGLQSPETGFGSTLAHLVTQPGSGALLRFGFRYAFGPAWWAVLSLGAIGLLMSTVGRGGPVLRMLGITGLVTAVAYVITPQSGTEFVFNVRYLTPALALGLVLIPLQPLARTSLGRPAALAALAVFFLSTQLDGALRPPGEFATWAAATLTAAGAFGLVGLLRHSRRLQAGVLVGAVGAAAVAGFYVQRQYLHNRYAYRNAAAVAELGPQASLWSFFAWARTIHHATIGLSGTQLQYPFFGLDISNRVRYLQQSSDHGRVVGAISSCVAWVRALDRIRPAYVVTTPVRFPFNSVAAEPPGARWTRALPGVVQIAASQGQVFLFRIDRLPRPGDCSRVR